MYIQIQNNSHYEFHFFSIYNLETHCQQQEIDISQLKNMGNNNTKGNGQGIKNKEAPPDQYINKGQSPQIVPGITGVPKIVKSKITDVELQQYEVMSFSETDISYAILVYKLRSSSYSKNIAVVFNHYLIDQEENRFRVRIQKMMGRLNQIQELTVLQALCILEYALNGFTQILYHSKVPFVVTDKMIAINQAAQIRVWANENFALNVIAPSSKLKSENQMIGSIQQAIIDHVSQDQRKNFLQFSSRINQCQKLSEAKGIISGAIQTVNKKAILIQMVQKQRKKYQVYVQNKEKKQIQNQKRESPTNPKFGKEKINLETEQFPINREDKGHNVFYKRQPKDQNKNNDQVNRGKISIVNRQARVGEQTHSLPHGTKQQNNNILNKIRQKLGGAQHKQGVRFQSPKTHKFKQRSKSPDAVGQLLYQQLEKPTLKHSQILVSANHTSPIRNKGNHQKFNQKTEQQNREINANKYHKVQFKYQTQVHHPNQKNIIQFTNNVADQKGKKGENKSYTVIQSDDKHRNMQTKEIKNNDKKQTTSPSLQPRKNHVIFKPNYQDNRVNQLERIPMPKKSIQTEEKQPNLPLKQNEYYMHKNRPNYQIKPSNSPLKVIDRSADIPRTKVVFNTINAESPQYIQNSNRKYSDYMRFQANKSDIRASYL